MVRHCNRVYCARQQKMQLIRYLQVDTAIRIKSAGDFLAMEHHSQQALMCMLTQPCPMFKLCIGMVLIQFLNAEMARHLFKVHQLKHQCLSSRAQADAQAHTESVEPFGRHSIQPEARTRLVRGDWCDIVIKN